MAVGGVAARVVRGPAGLPAVAWVVVGVIGWTALAALAARLLATQPPSAGFDLELLLEAGRRIAAGQSPYDPALVGGAALRRAGGSTRAAGVALAAACVAKLPPASLGIWFVLRGSAERRVAGVAVMAAVVIVASSLALGGLDPWRDYLAVIAAGSRAN